MDASISSKAKPSAETVVSSPSILSDSGDGDAAVAAPDVPDISRSGSATLNDTASNAEPKNPSAGE
jgi:hypothetical protein